jgi:hypothetical protein
VWFPSEAARNVAVFEHAFARMQHEMAGFGRVPPSREAILDRARTSRTLDAVGVVMYVRVHHVLPESGR